MRLTRLLLSNPIRILGVPERQQQLLQLPQRPLLNGSTPKQIAVVVAVVADCSV